MIRMRGDLEEISAGQGEAESVEGVGMVEYFGEEFRRKEEGRGAGDL